MAPILIHLLFLVVSWSTFPWLIDTPFYSPRAPSVSFTGMNPIVLCVCLLETSLTRTQGFYLLLYPHGVWYIYLLTKCFLDEWMYVWCLLGSLIKMTLSVSVLSSLVGWNILVRETSPSCLSPLHLPASGGNEWKQRCSPWLCPTVHLCLVSEIFLWMVEVRMLRMASGGGRPALAKC